MDKVMEFQIEKGATIFLPGSRYILVCVGSHLQFLDETGKCVAQKKVSQDIVGAVWLDAARTIVWGRNKIFIVSPDMVKPVPAVDCHIRDAVLGGRNLYVAEGDETRIHTLDTTDITWKEGYISAPSRLEKGSLHVGGNKLYISLPKRFFSWSVTQVKGDTRVRLRFPHPVSHVRSCGGSSIFLGYREQTLYASGFSKNERDKEKRFKTEILGMAVSDDCSVLAYDGSGTLSLLNHNLDVQEQTHVGSHVDKIRISPCGQIVYAVRGSTVSVFLDKTLTADMLASGVAGSVEAAIAVCRRHPSHDTLRLLSHAAVKDSEIERQFPEAIADIRHRLDVQKETKAMKSMEKSLSGQKEMDKQVELEAARQIISCNTKLRKMKKEISEIEAEKRAYEARAESLGVSCPEVALEKVRDKCAQIQEKQKKVSAKKEELVRTRERYGGLVEKWQKEETELREEEEALHERFRESMNAGDKCGAHHICRLTGTTLDFRKQYQIRIARMGRNVKSVEEKVRMLDEYDHALQIRGTFLEGTAEMIEPEEERATSGELQLITQVLYDTDELIRKMSDDLTASQMRERQLAHAEHNIKRSDLEGDIYTEWEKQWTDEQIGETKEKIKGIGSHERKIEAKHKSH